MSSAQVQKVQMVYAAATETERAPNRDLMKGGGIAALVGLLLAAIPATRGVGFLALVCGIAVAWYASTRLAVWKARPCPHCRTQISGRASVCLACQYEVPSIPSVYRYGNPKSD